MALNKCTYNFAGKQIEIIYIKNNGDLWMLANTFADVLGYSNRNQAIRENISQENQTEFSNLMSASEKLTSKHIQTRSKFINRAGLYQLILKSDMPNAKAFQTWITSQVLPTLEETGSYHMHTAPVLQQKQLNVMHQLTHGGAPANWYNELVGERDALKTALLKSKDDLIILYKEKDAANNDALIAYKKLADVKPLVVAVLEDASLANVLEIFQYVCDDGSFCYKGIRAQQRSIEKLRPRDRTSIFSSVSPNATNAFNKVKEFIPGCKVAHNNIFCSLNKQEFLNELHKVISQ